MNRALRSFALVCVIATAWCASAAAAPTDTLPRILQLESLGRGRATEAATQLEALRAVTAEHGAERLELLTVQGLMFAIASQPEASERAASQLEAWGATPKAPLAARAAAAALLIRARSLARSSDLPRADAMLQQAFTLLPADVPARERYRFVFVHAIVRNESGKLEDGVRLYHEALSLADRDDVPWRRAEARTSLGIAYYDARQIDRARALTTEALAIAERADDPIALGRAHSAHGIVLDAFEDRQGERREFELAIDFARRAGAKHDEVSYLANLSDFFLKSGDYKTALERAERALVLARELKDVRSETVALCNIGLAHIGLQHFELGRRFVNDAIAIDARRGSLTGVADLTRELAVYLEKAGDLPGAAAAYHEHRHLATRLLRDDQQKAILAMQEQYDADSRSSALVLLNRENEIKAAQLRRRDLEQQLWSLLAVACVLSLAVITLLYRRVRRTNRLLSTSNERLKLQSERDPLTGLANRRHFQTAMRLLASDGKLAGTVYLIDIDHFKQVNDKHGHASGDAVLVEVARRLRETLREQDLIVRWGGEEFLVIAQSLESEQDDALAQRMLRVLDREPIACGAQRVSVSASIGFATFPIGPDLLRVSWERAINLVDTAMYLAKAHGRNRAYGVRVLQARDETALDAITGSLESAWRDGSVALTLLQGRPPLAMAVAA